MLILHGETERPIANAIVTVLPMTPPPEILDQIELSLHGQDIAARHLGEGRRFRADAAGLVRVPRGRTYLSVACLYDDLWGEIHGFGPYPVEPHELRLYPDAPLVVDVVDAAGEPAPGVRVEIRQPYLSSGVLAERFTDSNGRVTFDHHRQYLESPYDNTHVGPGGLWQGSVGYPLEFDAPSEPIRFELPDYGELEVRIVDERGETVSQPAHVTVSRAYGEGEVIGVTTEVLVTEGRGRISPVGLGLDELRVSAGTVFEERYAYGKVDGPTRAGERVSIELTLPDPEPGVRLRVLAPDGSALSHADVECLLAEPGDSSGANWWSSTDGAGDLTFVPFDVRPTREVELYLRYRELGGSLAFTLPTTRGFQRVGEVRLAPLAPLLAGVVADPAGRPIAGARIAVFTEAPLVQDREYCDVEGAFSIVGVRASDTVDLEISHPLHLPEVLYDVRPGDEELAVTLERGGRIAGRLDTDPALIRFFVVRAVRQGDDEEVHGIVGDQGLFELVSLTPGTWDVSVGLYADNAAFVPDVEVRPGQTTRDPRLQALDFQDARFTSLTVVDSQGEPITEGYVYHRRVGSGRWSDGSAFADGEASILTTLERFEALVCAQGYRVQRVPQAGEGDTVTLAPAIPVRARWSEALPADRDLPLHWMLVSEDPDLPEGQVLEETVELDPSAVRAAELLLDVGTYTAYLIDERHDDLPDRLRATHTITIEDIPGTQEIEFELTDEIRALWDEPEDRE